MRKEDRMDDIVSQAKAELVRAKEQITIALATTPDDRINWSPSLTARTPIQQVAHAAMATSLVRDQLQARPFPYGSTAEFDAASRSAEKEYTTRAQALGILEQTTAEYLAWLDTLTPAQLASTVDTFFGRLEIASSLTIPAVHMQTHAAQIDFLQTTWGDMVWHR